MEVVKICAGATWLNLAIFGRTRAPEQTLIAEFVDKVHREVEKVVNEPKEEAIPLPKDTAKEVGEKRPRRIGP